MTLELDFCLAGLQQALRRGRPEIFNHDQGSQLTSEKFTGALEAQGIAVSMDERNRCLDNIFIERLWRSLKYEEVYLKGYRLVPEARAGIGRWLEFYNHERPLEPVVSDAGQRIRTGADKLKGCPVVRRRKDWKNMEKLEWRKQKTTRAMVFTTIKDILDELPRAYRKELYDQQVRSGQPAFLRIVHGPGQQLSTRWF